MDKRVEDRRRSAEERGVRLTRGLYASLGASGSLLAAGACALLVVSAVIAFRGWPAVPDVQVAPESLVVSGSRDADTSPARPPVSAPAVVAGGPNVAVAARSTPARGGEATASRPLVPGTTPPASSPSTASPTAAAPAPAEQAAASTTAATGPVRETARRTGDVVRHTTQTAATAVQPVSPQAAQAVQQIGDAVSDTADRTADAVSGLLKP
jgi:hypothetical protein